MIKEKLKKYWTAIFAIVAIIVLFVILFSIKSKAHKEYQQPELYYNVVALSSINSNYLGNIDYRIGASSDIDDLYFSVKNVIGGVTHVNDLFELALYSTQYFDGVVPVYTFITPHVPYRYVVYIDGMQVFQFGRNVTSVTIDGGDVLFLYNGSIVRSFSTTQGNRLSVSMYAFPDAQTDYERGYIDGYNEGESAGRSEGWQDGYNDGLQDGETIGENKGYNKGYQDALDDTAGNATGFKTLLFTVFTGLGEFLAIELLPGISIGVIILVPIVFGLLMFILGKRGD